MKERRSLMVFAIIMISLTIITNSSTKAEDDKKPVVKSTSPTDREIYVNPRYFWDSFEIGTEIQRGNYISVTFKNEDGNVKATNNSPSNSGFILNLNGNSTNLVDTDRKIHIPSIQSTGELKIYIPVKDEWSEGATYTAYIPGDLVYYEDVDGAKIPSDEYTWDFSIDSTPKVNKVISGSVSEDFDEDDYITLEGINFSYRTSVMFRSSIDGELYDAYYERYRSYNEDMLKVYLPRGRHSLPVGTYDIIVENGRGFESDHVYGVFSVVPEGDYVPNENYNKKDKDTEGETIRVGEIKKYTRESIDTLELDSKYTDRLRVELDLDKLMGEDVWTRQIDYKGYTSDTIDILDTYSKWSDISLYGVTLKNYTRDRDISIRVGRLEPTIADSIKRKLINENIKSDFIQVSGDNYRLDSLKIKIPFTESDGKRLKVLRYDENNRRFSEVNFKVNKIDKQVEFISLERGIFVVVE